MKLRQFLLASVTIAMLCGCSPAASAPSQTSPEPSEKAEEKAFLQFIDLTSQEHKEAYFINGGHIVYLWNFSCSPYGSYAIDMTTYDHGNLIKKEHVGMMTANAPQSADGKICLTFPSPFEVTLIDGTLETFGTMTIPLLENIDKTDYLWLADTNTNLPSEAGDQEIYFAQIGFAREKGSTVPYEYFGNAAVDTDCDYIYAFSIQFKDKKS